MTSYIENIGQLWRELSGIFIYKPMVYRALRETNGVTLNLRILHTKGLTLYSSCFYNFTCTNFLKRRFFTDRSAVIHSWSVVLFHTAIEFQLEYTDDAFLPLQAFDYVAIFSKLQVLERF